MKDTAEQIVTELLAQLRAQPLETIWTQYDSGDALIEAVEGAVKRLALDYASAVRDLSLLLAPTGAVQETAMQSGFHDEYMRLAARFDRVK